MGISVDEDETQWSALLTGQTVPEVALSVMRRLDFKSMVHLQDTYAEKRHLGIGKCNSYKNNMKRLKMINNITKPSSENMSGTQRL